MNRWALVPANPACGSCGGAGKTVTTDGTERETTVRCPCTDNPVWGVKLDTTGHLPDDS